MEISKAESNSGGRCLRAQRSNDTTNLLNKRVPGEMSAAEENSQTLKKGTEKAVRAMLRREGPKVPAPVE